jgi:hypothetical protein
MPPETKTCELSGNIQATRVWATYEERRFTKPLLYQLSYVGTERAKMASATRRIKNEAAAEWAQEEAQRSRRFRAAQFVLARFGAQLRNARSVRGKIRN